MSAESLFPDIPKKWTVTTLGELAKASGGDIQTGPFGSQLHASDYVDDGIPSIMPKNITVDAITTDDIARVSPDDVERLSKYKVQVGDIIYSRRGDVEKCARITETEDGWLCGTGCLRVRIKPTIISTEFLHAYLCHPVVREWIVRHAVGATMPNLNTSILSALPVVIPNKSEMTAIGSIWLTISDQIRLNSQINQTLEQMAQAIFKSWFVDFEPVKAKIAALEAGGSEEDALLAAMQAISAKDEIELARLQAEQPEQYAELRATAELFPSAMQDSELGEIPEGWTPTKLERHIELAYGKALKKDARVEGQYRVYGSGGVTGSHHEFLIPGPGIIVGRKGTVGSIYWEPDNFYPIDTTFYVTVKNGYSLAFAYYLLQTLGLSSMNTDAAVPGLNRNNVYRLQIPSFPTALVGQFSQIVASISEKISTLNAESRTLTELRDSLLPKLLSGALTAPIAEELSVDEAESANV
jgi:type I restriction enzyme S subunit